MDEIRIRVKCEEVENIYERQFGFDKRTTGILTDVYMKIHIIYPEEADWYYARSISQMGPYDSYKVASLETNSWFKGAGAVFPHNSSESFFVDQLGISLEDYRYLDCSNA